MTITLFTSCQPPPRFTKQNKAKFAQYNNKEYYQMSAVNEIVTFLKENRVFHIATIDEENDKQPRVRPFGAVTIYNDKIYIVTGNYKKVYAQFLKNPRIELSAMGQDGGFLRVEADIVIDDNLLARQAMLQDNVMLKNLYSATDGKMEVGYLANGKATFYAPNDMKIKQVLEF
jgi:uncharacterized pyridoxamine 5'-phosphate oxidase family protein